MAQQTSAERDVTAPIGARTAPAGRMSDAAVALLGGGGGDAGSLRVVPGDLDPGALAPGAHDLRRGATEL
jgi:hypothetical protein